MTGSQRSGGDFAWRPDAATRRRARVAAFMARHGIDSFEDLHRRSVQDVPWFTDAVLEFLDIRFHRPYRTVLDTSRGPEWPAWCVDGGLNISMTCLEKHVDAGGADSPAVIWEGEEGARRTMSYAELKNEVDRCAAGLRRLGAGRGTPVGLFLPMIPETPVALLALARIGAVAVPLFSGFGPGAIAARLQDVEAEILVTCDAFPRRGKPVPARDIALEAMARCPRVKKLVVVPRLATGSPGRADCEVAWPDLLAGNEDLPRSVKAAAGIDADAALIVLYTSGTSGRPKGIAHTHCSFPVKAAQDMAFGTDVGTGDRVLWVTDLGWMMGPWLIYGATILGGAMVLYDGAVDHPHPGRLWEVCARHRVTVLGVAPTLVRTLSRQPEADPAGHDMGALRILASTGEPWNPGPWWWLFEKVGGGRLPIINYSGGTEIAGGILMGSPLLPVKPTAFPAPCPGIDAAVFDESGSPVTGAVGELVIRKPWIGMARGFWRDPDRYLQTYWSRWPGVWVHGDWAQVDDDGQWTILGRSDDTFKVAGKRVGPAEVESVLVSHAAVREAAVVGVPHPVKGTALVAVCVPMAGEDAGPAAAEELSSLVAGELGKPLRPERLLFVGALPRTRNGKVMRRLVRAALLGEDPGDVSALENPEAMDALRRAVGAAGPEAGPPGCE